ncbi:MAG: metalloregulator ArsR/SmtB family transcription factor, partial [Pseudomonadota bacterium]
MLPDALVSALKAVAEPTRLRILMLLRHGELNVKDLTQILGQSQPRLSRHLKLLTEAGLVERFREGSWVYFYVSDRTDGGALAHALIGMADLTDPVLSLDRTRASEIKRQRQEQSQNYFETHAGDWDRIRSLHVSEHNVETAMQDALGAGPFDTFVDLGTGTGRILELFGDHFTYGIGFDVNQAMLTYARSKMASAGVTHAHIRHGDLYNVPMPSCDADVVVMHQVLHFLSEPHRAIAEAARVLKP